MNNLTLADVKRLLDQGANINEQTADGRTTLLNACLSGQDDTAAFLVEQGADVNLNNSQDFSPLYAASQHGSVDIVRLLIAYRSDVNVIETKQGSSPIHMACQRGHVEVVRLLLEAGAKVNAPTTKEQATSLHYAVSNSQMKVVKLLLDHGASFQAQNKNGSTPLDLAPTDAIKSRCISMMYDKSVQYNMKLKVELDNVKQELQTIKSFIFATGLANVDRNSSKQV